MPDDASSSKRLHYVLESRGRRNRQRSATPGSWKARMIEAWLREEEFQSLDEKEADEADAGIFERALSALKDRTQGDSDEPIDFLSVQKRDGERYPDLELPIQNPNPDPHANAGNIMRARKRKRECDDFTEELSQLGRESKKRRGFCREDPVYESNIEDPDAKFAVLMRKHLVRLDDALRRFWHCICRQCSGLSVGLSLPEHTKNLESEANFELFFSLRSISIHALQEARITVKDLENKTPGRVSEATIIKICQSVTESINQRCCLKFALEGGMFQWHQPEPKKFGTGRTFQGVSLSALFDRQQKLLGGQSVLPLKGKRVLAVTLASTLLPFLETPWLQFSFDYSKIQFFEPRQKGELPDITKPFLALEHVPINSTHGTNTGHGLGAPKYMIHPNTSVLALGILLFELHYCTPVELMTMDPPAARNIADDLYTCLDRIEALQDDAGEDYYLATKACLTGEYYPLGQSTDFEDASVQRLFYTKVVKRLEAVIFKVWGLRLEDLGSFDSRDNESCWGSVGREVVRLHTDRDNSPSTDNTANATVRGAMHETTPAVNTTIPAYLPIRLSGQPSSGPEADTTLAKPSQQTLHVFDASQQASPTQEDPLSTKWMNDLTSSISSYVPPYVSPVDPVRIAILDSGLDLKSSFLVEDQELANPQIKAARSFIHGTDLNDTQDEIGHGTHSLGLLLKVAPSAEIYIARIAKQETLDPNTYDDIAKAINHAVDQWKVDIISMSFGIREDHDQMNIAITNALCKRTLLFAAASNDGANLGRAFPARYTGVFCIHSTDGNGNPSKFNPTASRTDVNFSLLGEDVSSHWPLGVNEHHQSVNVMSGTSVATPIAAGLAASVLSFVRQEDQGLAPESEKLGPWLKWSNSMDAVFNSMVKERRGAGYDYITPHVLFDTERDPQSRRQDVYRKINDIKRTMYR